MQEMARAGIEPGPLSRQCIVGALFCMHVPFQWKSKTKLNVFLPKWALKLPEFQGFEVSTISHLGLEYTQECTSNTVVA